MFIIGFFKFFHRFFPFHIANEENENDSNELFGNIPPAAAAAAVAAAAVAVAGPIALASATPPMFPPQGMPQPGGGAGGGAGGTLPVAALVVR